MKKFVQWTAIVLGGLFMLAVLAGLIMYPMGMKKLNQIYPNITVETVRIPTDADAVARGKHIATVWACTRCHGEELSGKMISNDPLSGIVPLLAKEASPTPTPIRIGFVRFVMVSCLKGVVKS